MSGDGNTNPGERRPPTGEAWRNAQKAVSDRNDEARKAGRAQRVAYEKQIAALRLAEEKRGHI
jgi:hypothetical protein